MSSKTKKRLITATFLVFIGCIIFGGVMMALKWDFTKLSTVKYETNDYGINESYNDISIQTDTAHIVFIPTETLKTSVICYEQKNLKHTVTVKENTLTIELSDTRKWYERIGIFFGSPKITVYIPKGDYGALLMKTGTGNTEIPKDFKFESIDISGSTGDITNYSSASKFIKIKSSTGDINTNNISADTLNLSVSTGNVTVSNAKCGGDIKIKTSTGNTKLTNISCKNLISNGSTGDISLNNVIASEKFSIKRSTGNIKFDGCDATEIFAQTDTGDVKGTLLSDKVFITQSDTGKINVPKTVSGGKCEITTDTGNITIMVKE